MTKSRCHDLHQIWCPATTPDGPPHHQGHRDDRQLQKREQAYHERDQEKFTRIIEASSQSNTHSENLRTAPRPHPLQGPAMGTAWPPSAISTPGTAPLSPQPAPPRLHSSSKPQRHQGQVLELSQILADENPLNQSPDRSARTLGNKD